MAATSIPSDRKSARVALVQEHVRLENEHHLEGVLSTFGENAQYQDEAWRDRYAGRDGVRLYYEQLMAALPDLEIKILQEHVTDDNVLLEVLICGTASWSVARTSGDGTASGNPALRRLYVRRPGSACGRKNLLRPSQRLASTRCVP